MNIFTLLNYFRLMKPLILTLLVLSLYSCNRDASVFTLSGSAPGLPDGSHLILQELVNNQPAFKDSIKIENEKFNISLPKSKTLEINLLKIEGQSSYLFLFPENDALKITIHKDSLYSSVVKGSRSNELYTLYNKQLKVINKERINNNNKIREAKQLQDDELARILQTEAFKLIQKEKDFKKQFVKEYPNSLFSLLLLTEMLTKKEFLSHEVKDIIDGLSPKLAATTQAKTIKDKLAIMASVELGGKAPNFEGPTPNGTSLSLKDALGKFTIVDFWASWCKPCRAENPNLVRVYNKYHDKGLNILSVSLEREGQKAQWLRAIDKDGMTWQHVTNLKFWNDPIAQMYNVRAIPASFILDSNGIIIAKNLRGEALDKKISELFN